MEKREDFQKQQELGGGDADSPTWSSITVDSHHPHGTHKPM